MKEEEEEIGYFVESVLWIYGSFGIGTSLPNRFSACVSTSTKMVSGMWSCQTAKKFWQISKSVGVGRFYLAGGTKPMLSSQKGPKGTSARFASLMLTFQDSFFCR